MLWKITFIWGRRDMMRAVFKYLKSQTVEDGINLNFVTPEERIRSSRQKLHRHGFQLNLRKTLLMIKWFNKEKHRSGSKWPGQVVFKQRPCVYLLRDY